VDAEQKVTPLELFFDLAFVFAITQVTAMMAEGTTTWGDIGRGMLILAAIWWAWGGYAWLTNFLATDEGAIRAAIFVSMTAMLVLSIALPHAFGDDAVLFGACYVIVRVVHLVVYWNSAAVDEGVRSSINSVIAFWLLMPAMILVGGIVGGDLQYVIWIVALVLDYGATLVLGVQGWKVHAGHFAERFGLIMIIALGESLVAIGVGAAEDDLTAGVIVAVVLGVAIACAMWWAYFDVVAVVAERKLHEAEGVARTKMARDSYAYLHLPMIAGVVLFALGVKKTVGHFDEPLKSVPAAALCGGVAMYLVAHVAFRWRNVHSVNKQRLAAAALLLAFIPAATEMDALVALAAVAAVTTLLIAYEALRFREARMRLRHPQEAHA
jgi:low temperature requirement protein LtrA